MVKKTEESLGANLDTLISGYVTRGVFRAAGSPTKINNTYVYDINWFQDQNMILRIDSRRSTVQLNDFIPTITPRSSLDRRLRMWLQDRASPAVPAHRRLDASQFQLKLTCRAGHMQLSMVQHENDMLLATRKMIQIVNELYLDFLLEPAQYDWIIETFELDPDNPTWP